MESASRSAKGKLNVAVVGQGWWGKAIIRTLKESAKVQVVKAVDVNCDAGEFARSQGIDFTTDYGAAVANANIGAVILCTPHSLHTQQVALAAMSKKHVFCEKPLALTRSEAQESVDVCKSNGVVLGVGHELRFTPPMDELRRMLKAGELGTIVQSEATFSGLVSHAPNNWRLSNAEAPAGPMTGKGIHALDLCVSVHGPAERVFASLRNASTQTPNGDTLGLLLTFKSGANALISALWSSPFVNRFTVFGREGWAEVRDKAHPEKPEGWTLTKYMRGGQAESIEYSSMSPVLANLEAFADAVAGRATYPIPPEEMVANIAALEAIAKSAACGEVVQVEC